jgi:2',3'-cyclic-nucleotide 2'-phosphodiesterase (5'-nucleotidase family)
MRTSSSRSVIALLALSLVAGCAHTPASDARDARGTLVLMGTTDVHGWLVPHDYYTDERTGYGLSLLAPVIDSIRAEHPGRTALFDSGDLLQGNPLAFVFSELEPGERHPIIHAMNLLGYDAASVGNHEFNFGISHFDAAVAQAGFPFLASNVFHHGTERHKYAPHAVLEREVAGRPVRIGVTGAVPPGVHVWDRQHVEGRLDFRDIVESTRPVIRHLREVEEVDVVVVAAHNGLEGTSYDMEATGLAEENAMARLAREVPGIDVIFLGHTHREIADTTINGVLVTQADNWARSLAVAELDLVHDGERWQVSGKRGMVRRPDPARADSDLEAELAWAHEATREFVNRPIGRSTARWEARAARVRDTPIIDFINQVQRRVAGTDLSSAAAFNLDAVIPEGDVSVADIARLYVYDNNTLMAVRITGTELRAYLEKSAEYYNECPDGRCERVTNRSVPGFNYDIVLGVDYTFDLTRPVGERVVRLERDGRPVRDDETFTLALNNYRAGGGGGFPAVAGAEVVYDRGESIRDLLIEEIERRGTISPEDYFEPNWEIVPAELVERAAWEQAGTR